MDSLTIGSLFSGIGGLELGLEWAGLGPVRWQVEQDAFCARVLAQHWPGATRHRDVRDVGGHNLEPVDVVCGGFPCQDLSNANTRGGRRGLSGERSGLWREYARVLREIRPRVAIVENVAAWRSWLPVVRRDLAGLGYTSLPVRMCAGDLGAPHQRPRVFVVAHADREGESARALHAQVARLPELAGACRRDWGQPAAGTLGVADGLSGGLDARRLRALGNAVVPQCALAIGRLVMGLEAARG